MTVVLVPRLVSLGRDSLERRQFISELNGTILAIGIGASALIWLGAPAAAALLASGVNPYTRRTTAAIASEIARQAAEGSNAPAAHPATNSRRVPIMRT